MLTKMHVIPVTLVYLCTILFSDVSAVYHLDIPRVGFGTAGLGSRTYEVVCEALQEGYRLIDTAQAREWYREDAVGEALRRCKSKFPVTVITKIHPRSYEFAKMDAAIQTSLRNLNCTRLDVVLLHAPFCWEGHCTAEEEAVTWQQAWQNLERLHHLGLIHAIGVSNFHPQQLKELLSFTRSKVTLVQNWMDPFHQDTIVRDICRANHIHYMAYSSLGGQWEHILRRGNPLYTSSVLQSLSEKYHTTVPTLVLSWVMQEGAIIIPKAQRKEHVKENLLLEKSSVRITEEDMDLIRALDGTL